MSRVVGLELRRSSAPGLALAVALVGGLLLRFQLTASWTSLATNQLGLLAVLWPLALAGGSLLGMREPRTNVEELFTSTPRPRWQRLLPTAGTSAALVVLGYLVAFGAIAAYVAPLSPYVSVDVVPVLAVGSLSLVAAVWLGMAAGRVLPWRPTPPVLAVTGVIGLLGADRVLAPGSRILFMSPVTWASSSDFVAVRGSVLAGQALWFAALAAAAALLVAATSRRRVAAAAAPALLGAAVMLPIVPSHTDEGIYRYAPSTARLVCADGPPRICLRVVHQGARDEVTPLLRDALAKLSVLPDAPTSAVELRTRRFGASEDRQPADRLAFDLVIDGNGHPYPGALGDDIMLSLGTGGCAGGHASGGDQSGDQRSGDDQMALWGAGAWLWGKPVPIEEAAPYLKALQALPRSEAVRRVAEVRALAVACRGGAASVVTRGSV